MTAKEDAGEHLDSAGIWPPYQAFYIQSMLFNADSAMRSFARLEKVFASLPEEVTLEDIERLPRRQILNDLQNMVVQAGALSRYFWPVRKGHEKRAIELRHAFEMDESSPLLSRDLRNAIEHFDERLDGYVGKGIVGYLFPEFVGPKPSDDGVPGHFFRAYFVDVHRFVLLNEEFDMPPIADELSFIYRSLITMDREGGMLRRVTREVGNTSGAETAD